MAIAGVALALLTVPALAQTAGGPAPWSKLPGMKDDKPKDEESHSVRADDKAYKSSLESIPTKPKQTYDPWHNVRAAPQLNNPK